MLFNDAQMHQCLSIYFHTETGRRKPPGAVPPVAAKYLLVFIPLCVTSSDVNSGVRAGLPGGLQVFLGLPHGCIWFEANKVFLSLLHQKEWLHHAATFAEVKQLDFKENFDFDSRLILEKKKHKRQQNGVSTVWALHPDFTTH